MRAEPAGRIYLAAVPESIGGAYMLRNGIREALQVLGAERPGRVAVLSWYFVDPDAPAAVPVRAARARDLVRLTSAGPEPQVIVGTPDAAGLAVHDAAPTLDRFGRRSHATLRLLVPGAVWLVTPGGVQPVRPPAGDLGADVPSRPEP
jgi:hypothetical protein